MSYAVVYQRNKAAQRTISHVMLPQELMFYLYQLAKQGIMYLLVADSNNAVLLSYKERAK